MSRAAHLVTQANEQLPGAPAVAARLAAEALAAARREGAPEQLGRAQVVLGRAEHHLGNALAAAERWQAAYETFAGLSEAAAVFGDWLELGQLLLDAGESVRARLCYDRALDLARRHGQPAERAAAAHGLARAAFAQGDLRTAADALSEAAAHYRLAGDAAGRLKSLNNLGLTWTELGEFSQALTCFLEAYQLVCEQSPADTRAYGSVLVNVGYCQMEMGDLARAKATLENALATARTAGDAKTAVAAAINLGHTALGLDSPELAERLFEQGHADARAAGLAKFEASALDGLGRVQAVRGHAARAARLHREAAQIAQDAQETNVAIDARLHLTRALLKLGRLDEAHRALLEAQALAEASARRKPALDIHALLAQVCERRGEHAAALRHFRAFHALDKALFNEASERRTAELTGQVELERARHEAEMYRLRIQAAQEGRIQAEAQVRERTEELELARLEAVTRLALAAEYRDDVTGKHTWRVGHYAAHIARAMHMSEEDVELIRVAARLHDVGKIGIPDAVLLKPGTFSPAEYERMKAHPIIGANILSGSRSKLLQLAEVVALTHHERWDGGGYPRQLAGEAIPLVGRIVSAADVFDALTHERPYKCAWSYGEALVELERQSGSQFDPAVIKAALKVFGDPDFFESMELKLSVRDFVPDVLAFEPDEPG